MSDPTKTWDWGRMQYLSGLVFPRAPAVWPFVTENMEPVKFGAGGGSDAFRWFGWSTPENGGCWNDGRRAGGVFRLEKPRPIILRLEGTPFLYPGKVEHQALVLRVNGHELPERKLSDSDGWEWSIPAVWLREKNVIDFRFPDGQIPWRISDNGDPRQLALFVRTMEWRYAK